MRSRLQIDQMKSRELVDRECGLDEKNIDRAMYMRAIQQRDHNCREAVVERGRSVISTDEARVACGVTSCTCFCEDSVEPLRVTGKLILGLLGFPQPLQDALALAIWAEREIGSPHTAQ